MRKKDSVNSPLYGCRLGSKYIANNSAIVESPIFERSVVKIQKGKAEELTEEEKLSVTFLRKDDAPKSFVSQAAMSMTMSERMAKKRKVISSRYEYVACDFILGSVAKVERLWSIAKIV